MLALTYRAILIGAAAISLAACGGSDGGIGSTPYVPKPTPTPTPTPTPPPTPALIPGATTSQEFSVAGATFKEVAFPKYDGPLMGAHDQVRIRYDADKNLYEIMDPSSNSWSQLGDDGWAGNADGSATYFALGSGTAYNYSGVAGWSNDANGESGTVGFGAPTPQSGVPLTGSATYEGSIFGRSTETYNWYDWGTGLSFVNGTISLAFDFGAGSLAGELDAHITGDGDFDLPTLTFTNTVYSTGSTSFSGKFDTNLNGANAFSGLFTGPNANELIGNFAFPYKSPLDGKNYQAGGAFVAKH